MTRTVSDQGVARASNRLRGTGILIQARMSSARLPGKMLMPLGGIPLIEFVYKRCQTARRPGLVAVLTSESPTDDILHAYCREHGMPVFRGDLEDVLGRYLAAANYYDLRFICRVCGDSPFVDTEMIDKMLVAVQAEPYDYVAVKGCIDGFFAEVVPRSVLQAIAGHAPGKEEREHVTLAIRRHLEHYHTLHLDMNQAELAARVSLTVDTAADLEFCNRIASLLPCTIGRPGFDFSSLEIISILDALDERRFPPCM